MALTTSQYRTMRDLFRGALSVDSANPSDADVLSFFKQFLADAVGSLALSNSRQFLAGEIARRILSGNFSNASDANVVDFWTALATDANAGSAMGQTAQYQTMKKALVGAFNCDFFNPTQADLLSYINFFALSFSGDFTPLLTGAKLFAVQGDRGIASSGGIITGVTDQSAGLAFSSNSASQRPLVGVGYNGHASITFDGVDDEIAAAVVFPNPSVTPYYCYAIFKPTTKAGQSNYFGGGAVGGGVLYSSTGNVGVITQTSGSAGNTTSMTNALTRVYAEFTGTTSDRIKSGAQAFVTGASSGTTGDTLAIIGAGVPSGILAAQIDLALVVYATGALIAPTMATIDAQAVAYWGSVLV